MDQETLAATFMQKVHTDPVYLNIKRYGRYEEFELLKFHTQKEQSDAYISMQSFILFGECFLKPIKKERGKILNKLCTI